MDSPPSLTPIVVGISGYAGSGKDTLAQSLSLSQGFVCTAFADKLKEVLSDIYDVPLEYFHERHLKNVPHPNLNGKTPREAAQCIGTEAFRNMMDPMTWVNYAIRKAKGFLASGLSVVITDVRFPEEVAAIRQFENNYLVGLVREGCESYAHESERHIPWILGQCDRVVENNGSISDLLQRGDEIVSSVRAYTHL